MSQLSNFRRKLDILFLNFASLFINYKFLKIACRRQSPTPPRRLPTFSVPTLSTPPCFPLFLLDLVVHVLSCAFVVPVTSTVANASTSPPHHDDFDALTPYSVYHARRSRTCLVPSRLLLRRRSQRPLLRFPRSSPVLPVPILVTPLLHMDTKYTEIPINHATTPAFPTAT